MLHQSTSIYARLLASDGTYITTSDGRLNVDVQTGASTLSEQQTQTTHLSTIASNINDSLFSIQNGAKNSYDRHGRILVGTSTTAYLCSEPLTTSIPAKPNGNVKVKLVGNDTDDDLYVIVRGVDVNGNAVTDTVHIVSTTPVYVDGGSGTTTIESGTKRYIWINDVEARQHSPLGKIYVYLDYADNDFGSGSFQVGRLGYRGRHLECAWHLVPNNRRVCFTSALMNIEATSGLMCYICKTKDWFYGGGSIAASDFRNYTTIKAMYLSTSNVNVDLGGPNVIAEPLELIAFICSSSLPTSKYGSFSIVEYDA